jgi:prophage tail gpP-like protein
VILKIGNKKFDHYNEVSVLLNYDSVASSFSFSVYFDPDNAEHKAIFKPGSYQAVTIEHDGETLITGTLLVPEFNDGPVVEPLVLSGYSKTGVLEDCEIPQSAYPLQADGLTLKQIAEKILKPFKLKLVVDSAVSSAANSKYTTSTASDKQKIKEYLCELAGQKNIIVSHNEKGELLLTKAKATQTPIFDFNKDAMGFKYRLSFNGQQMHSSITLQKQASKSGKGNAGLSTVNNPYASSSYRPRTHRQTSGTDVNTKDGVRNLLSEELKALSLTITMKGWTLNGKIVRPNSVITITNKRLHIYKQTKFFISSVDLKGDNTGETATLTCVLPEVFNGQTPKNIFD